MMNTLPLKMYQSCNSVNVYMIRYRVHVYTRASLPSPSIIGPILWGHSGPVSRVVVGVVDIDAQAACDSSDTW